MRALILAAALLLAGCADPSSPTQEGDGQDYEIEVDSQTGGIRGVVVDDAVVPVAEAAVRLASTDPPRETMTDAEGRFGFSKLPPGVHVLQVQKYGYEPVQSSVAVEAGVAQPGIVRVQLVRSYSEEPFSVPFDFSGRVVCSYKAVLITAPCITDYTSLVCPGGCAPQLREVQGDQRDWVQELLPGWKSHVIEMTWSASAQGTSEELGFTVSHTKRTADHWYGSFGGPNPVLGRLDCCAAHPSQQNAGPIPEDGLPDLMTFVNVRGSDYVELAVEQDFQVITHTFYHLAPPEGWSFIAGDQPPF